MVMRMSGKLLEREPYTADDPDDLRHTFGQSRTIVITTRGSYNGHVKQIMKDIHYPPKPPRSRKVQQPVHIYWNIAWGRVVADEAHFEVTPTSGTIQLFKNAPVARKWFLTGTPFERSPAQMAGWIGTLETRDWTEPRKYPSWPEKEAHCAKLKLCTASSLRQMGKMHDRIVAGKETDRNTMNRHIKLLTDVLGTLWLKRSATRSLFFGNPLTEVIANTHYVINCPLPTRYNELVNSPLMTITDQLKKEHAVAKAKWVDDGCIGPEPSITANHWMMKVRRLRVLSSFPRLGELDDTKSLTFSGTEDRERNWVRMKKGRLYEVEECGSPYERHIADICSEDNCPKIKAINDRIQEWDNDEKAVFCSMGPTNALILYWVCSTLLFTPKLQPQ